MFLFEYCQGALRSKRDDRDGQVRAMSHGRHVVVSVMGGGRNTKKKFMQGKLREKKNMHSEYPRNNVLAYGKKYSCKGNVNEKKSYSSNSPHPHPSPHNFSNGPFLTLRWISPWPWIIISHPKNSLRFSSCSSALLRPFLIIIFYTRVRACINSVIN